MGRFRLIQNSEPSPGVLSTPISPPICSINRLEITRPKPVPPGWRDSELSAWLNAWNRARTSWLDRPMPVSCTLMRNCTLSSCSSSIIARATMVPSRVNLIALLIRLVRICLSRSGSPTNARGVSRYTRLTSSSCLACAAGARMVKVSCSKSRRLKGTLSSTSLPASIFEKSRISLMMPSRLSADFSIVPR
ncbi:hypothetical protein PFLmoz3_05714 [Pseudomonas fluorescens]|uniref:Uncharacterized protein n=1 Tax=Pseudomonas fluorescens TaxID=294 RepID=A0A109LBT8_PSEFL|nr:hypothetical protein PFLmoz3_05714 [Pseudomonas fluorescens]